MPAEGSLSEESEILLTLAALDTCLTSWTLGPAHVQYHLHWLLLCPADFPVGLDLCFMPDPLGKAGLWSLLGSLALQSSKKNVGKEDYALG